MIRASIVVCVAWTAFGSVVFARQAPSPTTSARRFLMGTSISVEVSGGDADTRADVIDEAFAAMTEVDRVMSNYRSDSELAAVNAGAAKAPIVVSDALFSVLAAAEDVSRRSNGAFDITVGPLMKLWGFYQKQPHVPNRTELDAVRPVVGYLQLLLDPRARTVRFARQGMELDLGGIAKGFAVELAGNVVRRRGLSGYIDAGGNQYFVGTPVGKARWQVGIEDPDRQGALLGVLSVGAGSVATSGGYHNYFEVDGIRYGHILDPRTLLPSDRSLSVTVVAQDATIADALTKAVFLLGPIEGLALLKSFPGTSAIVASRASGGVDIAISDDLRSAFAPTRPRLGATGIK